MAIQYLFHSNLCSVNFWMVNGLSISFFVVLFNFFSFLWFPLFSRWLSNCLYLKPFQWVHVKVLAELEILESNAVCYYVTIESNPFVSFTHVGLFCLAVYMLLCFVFRSDYCLRQKNVQMGHIRAVMDAVYLLPWTSHLGIDQLFVSYLILAFLL